MQPPAPDDQDAEGDDGEGQDDDQDQGGEAPTPEEQAQYTKFVDLCYQALYSPDNDFKVLRGTLAHLHGREPISALATAIVAILTRVLDVAMKGGAHIDPIVLLKGGIEVLQDLANTASKAGIHDYTPEEMTKAVWMATDQFRAQAQKQGLINTGAMQQDFNDMMSASKAGKLDDLIPGASAAATHLQGMAKDSADKNNAGGMGMTPDRGGQEE